MEDKEIKRDQYKSFYGSSYDRGLDMALEMWRKVKKEVPEATLEIAYGWDLFDRFHKDNPGSKMWKAELVKKINEYDGITEYGRLSQPEVVKLMEKCSVWTFPTYFGEINCITALKSQALGLEPVVVNYAALKETVQYGRKVEGDIYDQSTKDEFLKQWIDALKNPMSDEKRQEMMKWANEKYKWSVIAKSWDEEFKL